MTLARREGRRDALALSNEAMRRLMSSTSSRISRRCDRTSSAEGAHEQDKGVKVLTDMLPGAAISKYEVSQRTRDSR